MPGYTHSEIASPCGVTVSVSTVSVASSGFCGAVRLPRQAKLSTAVAAVNASSAPTSRRVHFGCAAGCGGDCSGSRSGRGSVWPWRVISHMANSSSTKQTVSTRPVKIATVELVALVSHSSSEPVSE